MTLDPEEMQMLFNVHTSRFQSIYDYDKNFNLADSTMYFDKSMEVS